MIDEPFKQIKDKLELSEFNANIEDGKFIIEPANAGIVLLAALQTQQETIDSLEEHLELTSKDYETIVDENEDFRELLHECLNALPAGSELALTVEERLWRVSGITSDGTEITIDYKKEENNE